jgi:hypothetical protein
MVFFIDQLFHLMMQPCIKLNIYRKKLNHVQRHFLIKSWLFFGMILSDSSTTRNEFIFIYRKIVSICWNGLISIDEYFLLKRRKERDENKANLLIEQTQFCFLWCTIIWTRSDRKRKTLFSPVVVTFAFDRIIEVILFDVHDRSAIR